MKKLLIITLLISCYFLSCYENYNWFQKAFSKNGRWNNLHTDSGTVFFTVAPFFNSIAAICNVFDSPYKDGYNGADFGFDNFFNVKK